MVKEISSLFEDNYKELRDFAKYLRRGAPDYEDLLSVVFLELIERHEQIKGLIGVGYIKLRLRSRSVDMTRNERTRQQVGFLDDTHSGGQLDPEESLLLVDKIQSMLGKLSERERESVRLCHGEEFTAQEAADILGVSVHTVRSHLASARRKAATV